jgi:hypothetical protein
MSDLKKTLELLKKQVAELEAKLNKPEKFEPLDKGWFLDGAGHDFPVYENKKALNKWNCFPTEQDAERRQKLREAEDELYNLWLHITGGWEPDWKNVEQNKHYFYYNWSANKFNTRDYNFHQVSSAKVLPDYCYYPTEEQTKQAIELMSDHAKWYLREG